MQKIIRFLRSCMSSILQRQPTVRQPPSKTYSTEQLIAIAQSQDWNGALQAIQALGEQQSPEAVEPLSRLVRSFVDNWLVLEAITTLGKIKDARALPALIDALYAQELQADYEQFYQNEQKMNRTDVHSKVASAMYLDEIGQIRAKAAWALGQIGSEEAVPHLVAVLHETQAPSPHEEAADALKRIGTPLAEHEVALWRQRQKEAIDRVRELPGQAKP
jgi:HEAT repeat protein